MVLYGWTSFIIEEFPLQIYDHQSEILRVYGRTSIFKEEYVLKFHDDYGKLSKFLVEPRW